MNTDWINMGILAAAFLGLFGVAEFLFHVCKVKAELTRKFVHIGTGVLTMLFPVMLGNQWLVLLLCTAFAVLLIASLYYRLLPSINGIDRFSVGSLAYPVSVYGCYLLYDYHRQDFQYFYVPVLTLAICDPVAALTGKRWPKGKYKVGNETKTLMGSVMFTLTAWILFVALSYFFHPQRSLVLVIWQGLIIAMCAAIAEAVSRKGTDNLTIPLGAALALLIVNNI